MGADERYEPLPAESSDNGLGEKHTQLVNTNEIETSDVATEKLESGDAEHVVEASKGPRAWLRATIWGRSWHMLVKSGALTASLVLLINVTTLIVAYTGFTVKDHLVTVWTGNCERAGSIVTVAHLIINILGSLLLAASNASMQALASPTRREVDVAHSKRIALAIGVPSYRNLLRVSRLKVVLWMLLALSSLPLHFFWNSAVIQTLATNNYYAIAVAPDFAQGSPWIEFNNTGTRYMTDRWQLDGMSDVITNMQRLAQNNRLQRLERSECIRAYGRELVFDRRNLLLVTDHPDLTPKGYKHSTSLLALYASSFSLNATMASSQDSLSYGWMCLGPDECQLSTISALAKDMATPWFPGYVDFSPAEAALWNGWQCDIWGEGNLGCGHQALAEVSYCLSEEVDQSCSVGILPSFLTIVCICNIIKIVAFLMTLWISGQERPLVTHGDAIASFIKQPCTALRGRCLATRRNFVVYGRTVHAPTVWAENLGSEWTSSTQLRKPGPITHEVQVGKHAEAVGRKWSSAVSTARWIAIYVLISGSLATAATLFTKVPLTYGGSKMSQSDAWALFRSQRLGEPFPSFTKSYGKVSIILAFSTANMPQIVLSYLYTAINNILTCMLGMAEWTSWYASASAKGLRVSDPAKASAQRSAYFLTLPLRWGVPNLVFFALLHWLLSQMVFAAKIETINFDGRPFDGTSVTAVYYSPTITIAVACLGAGSMIGLLLVARFKQFAIGAPLAGNCSASIAAACQPSLPGGEFEPGLELKKLRWGVVDLPNASNHALGHATFSDYYVGRLVPGMKYA